MISLLLLLFELFVCFIIYNIECRRIEQSNLYPYDFTINGRKIVGNYYLESIRQEVNSKRSKF